MDASDQHTSVDPLRMRVGCRFRNPTLAAKDWMPRDFGEDWVVPRAPVTFLLVHSRSGGSELTAFDEDGKIVGDMHGSPDLDLVVFLQSLHERGLVTRPASIPPGTSAVDFLRESHGL